MNRSRRNTREEERELATRARAGDEEARTILIESNMDLANWVAYTMSHVAPDLSSHERSSCATLGLVDAVDRFNPDCGCRLSTYAFRWMVGRMKEEQRTAMPGRPHDASLLADRRDGHARADERMDAESAVAAMLATLPERDREIVSMRFGIGREAPMRYSEIEAESGVSKSVAQRIVERALDSMGRPT